VGDNRTPEGDFTISSIEDSRSWTHDFRDGKGAIRGAYGPWFIRLATPGWKGIGIHGTHDPDSIGTAVTEGCIRLKNADLIRLAAWISVGIPVTINP
jgi:lipoprotein-anchoring transpeptidase ErfK/SrfK